MSGIKSKITKHVNKPEQLNHNQEENQSMKTDLKMIRNHAKAYMN